MPESNDPSLLTNASGKDEIIGTKRASFLKIYQKSCQEDYKMHSYSQKRFVKSDIESN